jgi:hypothetical protein
MNCTKSANCIKINISTYDYETNASFYANIIEYFTTEWYTRSFFNNLTDIIYLFCLPTVALFGIILNLICIIIFLNPIIKSLIYKYLLFNSLFDFISLILILGKSTMNLIQTPIFNLHTNVYDIYFFVYFLSVMITCSNMTKIALLLERIFKLKKCCKWFTNKKSFKFVMSLIIIISFLLNSPLIYGFSLFSNAWSKHTYFLLTLNKNGINHTLGVIFIINAILVDIGVFILVIVMSVILLIVIKLHKKKLGKMELEGKNSNKRIGFEIVDNDDDDDDDEDDENEEETSSDGKSIEIVYNNPAFVITSSEQFDDNFTKFNERTNQNHLSSSEPKASINNLTNKTKKNTKNNVKSDVEKTKCQLSKMIQMTCLFYIFGHILFSICELMIQIKYFFYYGPMMNIPRENYPFINFLIALSYLFLYLSFSLNFLAYYKFDVLFGLILCNKSKDVQVEENTNPNEEQKQNGENY